MLLWLGSRCVPLVGPGMASAGFVLVPRAIPANFLRWCPPLACIVYSGVCFVLSVFLSPLGLCAWAPVVLLRLLFEREPLSDYFSLLDMLW